jgi:hypothetical protein
LERFHFPCPAPPIISNPLDTSSTLRRVVSTILML